MAIKSLFFTSSGGDRKYTSADLATLIGVLARTGFFVTVEDDRACQASAVTDTMTVSVAAGVAMIEGCAAVLTGTNNVTVPAAHPSLPRIDRVVLRRDLSPSVRANVLAVIEGEAAASPVAPDLTRDGYIYELGIADVLVPAGVSTLNTATLADIRLDADFGGIAGCGLLEQDTAPKLIAPLDCNGHTIDGNYHDNGNSGSAITIDWRKGNYQRLKLTANCTVTFVPPDHPAGGLKLEIHQDAVGGRTLTLPTIRWAGDNAPIWSTAANSLDVLALIYTADEDYLGAFGIDY